MENTQVKKMWEVAKIITEKIKYATELMPNEENLSLIDWDMIEEEWFDYLEDKFFLKNLHFKNVKK